MNSGEQERFESELRGVKPARPSAQFMQRLVSARPATAEHRKRVGALSGEQNNPLILGMHPSTGSYEHGLWAVLKRLPGIWRPRTAVRGGGIVSLWRWLVPAAALAVTLGAVWQVSLTPGTGRRGAVQAASSPNLKADDVQIDQELVSTFDTVTPLPNGEPVRLRCREWMDHMVFQDSARGVTIERRTPRLEVVSVKFESY